MSEHVLSRGTRQPRCDLTLLITFVVVCYIDYDNWLEVESGRASRCSGEALKCNFGEITGPCYIEISPCRVIHVSSPPSITPGVRASPARGVCACV